MKELPLLSSDFEPFLWSQSNGEASLEQTQESFNALYNKDMCYKFSYLVWNDLVDKLNDALTQAGLTWKTTYGTVSSTKLTDKLTDFTARRFNSVAYNIDHLINTTWKWEYDKTLSGYLGRMRMKGYRDTKNINTADDVYGWYIIELVRILNLFIRILKDEADFGELAHEYNIEVPYTAPLLSRKSAPFEYQKIDKLNVDAPLDPRPIGVLDTGHNAIIRSNDDAPLDPRTISYLVYQKVQRLDVDAPLDPRPPERLITDAKFQFRNYADILVERIKYLDSLLTIKSFNSAPLKARESLRLKIEKIIISLESANLKPTEPFRLEVLETDMSISEGKLTPALSGKLRADVKVSSIGYAHLFLLGMASLIHDYIIRSSESADISAIPSDALTVEEISKTMLSAPFNKGVAGKMSSSFLSKSSVDGVLNKGLSAPVWWEYLHSSIHDAEVKAKESKPLDFKGLSHSDYQSSVNAIRPKYAEAKVISESSNETEVIVSRPKLIGAEDTSKSIVDIVLSLRQSITQEASNEIHSLYNAALTKASSNAVSYAMPMFTQVYASLTLQGIDIPWIDPEWTTETNLYIRQVWLATPSGTNLHID